MSLSPEWNSCFQTACAVLRQPYGAATQVLVGDSNLDESRRLEAAQVSLSLAGLMPQAQVDWLAGATHAMLDSHPREVAAFIARLCSR
jgi:hypothetical protein